MSADSLTRLPRLYLIDDVAEILGVSTRTIRRMIAKGELGACRLGRSVSDSS